MKSSLKRDLIAYWQALWWVLVLIAVVALMIATGPGGGDGSAASYPSGN